MPEMINFNLANPYQEQLAELDRRQRMAEILASQAYKPMEAPGSYKGIQAPISHLAGLAKILEGYTAGREERAIREERKALGEKYRSEQAADTEALIAALQPTPAVAGRPEFAAAQADFEDNPALPVNAAGMVPAVAPVAARPYGQIDMATMRAMKTPEGRNMALTQIMAQRQADIDAARREAEPFTLGEGQIRYRQQPGGGLTEVARGGVKPVSQFAPIDPSKYTPESITAAMKPDGTINQALLVARPVARTGDLGLYDEYAAQMRAQGRIPKSIEQFLTDQKIAGRTPAAVTYGSPVAAVDVQGNPVFIQPGRGGGAPSVIQGYAPPPKEAPTPSEGERKAATLLSRLQFSQQQLADVLKETPSAAKPEYAGVLPMVGNVLTSGPRQRVEAAQLDILDAALTLGTGAAYTKEQLEGYRKSYFPQIGDSEGTIADKQMRLSNVINAAKIAAGRAAPDTAQPRVRRFNPNTGRIE
jgi:hypothetical protein